MANSVRFEDLVPNGILPSDHVHLHVYDETCSRCRKPIPDHEVPLQIFEGNAMLSYCEPCCGVPAEETLLRKPLEDGEI